MDCYICPIDGALRATAYCGLHRVDLSRTPDFALYRGGVSAPARRSNVERAA